MHLFSKHRVGPTESVGATPQLLMEYAETLRGYVQ
jgi:hypothetical protein